MYDLNVFVYNLVYDLNVVYMNLIVHFVYDLIV
jgi:hypothetical protein